MSMLLLSVSEARVCSVDMDEISLAEEDWEAEPDTTSDTLNTKTTDRAGNLAAYGNNIYTS